MPVNLSMPSIRQILVPVDFSEPSRVAFDYAADLARVLGASLDVLHVWEPPSFIPTVNVMGATGTNLSLLELIEQNAERALKELVSAAAERGISVRASRAEAGTPAHTITEAAKNGHYDLVVIGTRGRTGLSRAFIGSVAERVVRHAPCPVLSVRTPEPS